MPDPVAFGMTRRGGRSSANDPGLVAVINAETDATCLVGKTWDFHVKKALGVTLDENLQMITDSLTAAKDKGREPMFDCEHFFDGYKSNQKYTLDVVAAARDGGAEWIVLCDTNGGTLTSDVYDAVKTVAHHFPDIRIGIHTHNDAKGLLLLTHWPPLKQGQDRFRGQLTALVSVVVMPI